MPLDFIYLMRNPTYLFIESTSLVYLNPGFFSRLLNYDATVKPICNLILLLFSFSFHIVKG